MHKFIESYVTGVGYDDLTELGQEAKPMAEKVIEIGLARSKSIMARKLHCIILGYMLGLLTSFVIIMAWKVL